jgi:hypothetical protein
MFKKVADKARRDHLRNKGSIRIVGTISLVRFIQKLNLKWFIHFMRISPMSPTVKVYNMNLEAPRSRGRPKIRRIERVILRLHNITVYLATENMLLKKPIIDMLCNT